MRVYQSSTFARSDRQTNVMYNRTFLSAHIALLGQRQHKKHYNYHFYQWFMYISKNDTGWAIQIPNFQIFDSVFFSFALILDAIDYITIRLSTSKKNYWISVLEILDYKQSRLFDSVFELLANLKAFSIIQSFPSFPIDLVVEECLICTSISSTFLSQNEFQMYFYISVIYSIRIPWRWLWSMCSFTTTSSAYGINRIETRISKNEDQNRPNDVTPEVSMWIKCRICS